MKKTIRMKTGCWIWPYSLNSRGYSQAKIDGKVEVVHRVTYEAFKGKIPYNTEVDHMCGNRACVNPDHLEAVTHVKNVRRGRATKLSWAQVKQIRRLSGSTLQKDIAERFGIAAGTVSQIVMGKIWK